MEKWLVRGIGELAERIKEQEKKSVMRSGSDENEQNGNLPAVVIYKLQRNTSELAISILTAKLFMGCV